MPNLSEIAAVEDSKKKRKEIAVEQYGNGSMEHVCELRMQSSTVLSPF